jgi:hypothetical protein
MITYAIRIGGELPACLLDRIGGAGTPQPAGTMFEIDIADEAGLWGLIDALRANGVDMLEVRRQEPLPPESLSTSQQPD